MNWTGGAEWHRLFFLHEKRQMNSDITSLASGVHLAWIGDDVVILDVEGDGYACMVGAARHIRPTETAGIVAVDPAWQDDLAATGLTSRDEVNPPRRLPTPPREALQVDTQPQPLNVVRAAGHIILAYRQFERTSFPGLIALATDRRRPRPPHPRDGLSGAVGTFLTVHAWVPNEGDCLKRSFALHRHLRGCGIDADWVFGVRTWPFLAHCWIQCGNRVVGDSIERISGFTPIMVVG